MRDVEARALVALCGANGSSPAWEETLAGLGIDEAAMLPRRATNGELPKKFTIAPRLTTHVRHRAKYLDVPMPEGRAFHFTCDGKNFGTPARTLKEFIQLQQRMPAAVLEGHAKRSDFSHWISKVFGDQPLAEEIRKVEKRHRRGKVKNLSEALNQTIRERYEMRG